MSSFNEQRLAMWRDELSYSQQMLHSLRTLPCSIPPENKVDVVATPSYHQQLRLQTKFLLLALDKVWEFQEAVRLERSSIIDHDGNTTWSD